MSASWKLVVPVLAGASLITVGVLSLMQNQPGSIPTAPAISPSGPITLILPGDTTTTPPAIAAATIDPDAPVHAVVVDLADVPSGVHDTNSKLDRWLRGEVDFSKGHKMRSDDEIDALREAAFGLPPIAIESFSAGAIAAAAPVAGVSFDSIDYNGCCGGGGNVPPDPEMAAGPNHLIAAVNVSFEIYDKTGVSLVGPTTYASLFATTPGCSTSLFDPNVLYDEREDRFILGIDGDGSRYCIAVSATGDPTGSWFTYAFATNASATEFFDYPHAGVGEDAIFLGANMFLGNSFLEGRVWALDKMAMYAGAPATSLVNNLGASQDTPQPLNLHGWNQGTWPTDLKHYFFSATNFNGANHTLWQWDGPFSGPNSFTSVASVNLDVASGVSSGFPVSAPQSGGSALQANDWRPLDFEYRNGFGWTTGTISCNPGGGTVNCVRWAQIDLATGAIGPEGAGVTGTPGDFRFFPDLAVNDCGDMAIGYTKTSTSTFPGIWYTGRETTDSPGTLQPEALQRAGDIAYTAFDPAPHRWGDYTGMTIDPDGVTFWYLGEFSKNTGTTQGRWGTNIGSFTFANCATGTTGACCAADGTCSIETSTACAGTYQGDNTGCVPNTCPQPPTGACCAADGTCTEATAANCTDTYQGDNTTCAPNLCPLPPSTGACCATDGACAITEMANCTGTYQGDDTVCDINTCPQPATGACCALDGTCTIETAAACGGAYQGNNTTCVPNICPAPPAGPPCSSIRRLRARCNDNGSLDVLVALSDNTHNGETVTVAINGAARVVPIVGRLASHNECCPQGQLTVTLELPSGCIAPVVLFCGTDPTGACCAVDGTCTTTTSSTCVDTYQGDGTTCVPNLCPQPPATGACCAADGTCAETTAADCADAYQGDNTTCVPNLCPQPPATGACCAADGTCAETTAADCADAYQGDNTTCVPNLCPQPPATGACCAADGTCAETTAANCADAYQGDNTTCVPNLCPQPPATGACCAADGTCAETTAADCADAYQGDNTTCVPNLCPLPTTGACCAPDGSCMVMTPAECIGTYQGDDTACAPNNCPLPPAGPTCSDIRRLRARCNADDGTTDILVVLQSTANDGETVTVGINGALRTVPIVGRFASHTECCPQGALTISLELPSGCIAPVELNCGP